MSEGYWISVEAFEETHMPIDLGLDEFNDVKDSKYGFVCAMDVLGVRQKSTETPHEIIEKLLQLNKYFLLEKFSQDHVKNRDRMLSLNEHNKYYTVDASIDLFVLGDTYFIAYRLEHDPPWPTEFQHGIGSILRFFRLAMENGFMMRGAISIGKYHWLYGQNLVVGPAISDAIEWCEKANWIGLHFTPNGGDVAKNAVASLNVIFKNLFFEYNVPLKIKLEKDEIRKEKQMFCIGWPLLFCLNKLENPLQAFKEGAEHIRAIFEKEAPPEYAHEKYENAWLFFNAYRDWNINVWHPEYKKAFELQVKEIVDKFQI